MNPFDDLAERLRVIEEELRDRAYAHLREAVERGDDASAEEKRLNQARRAVEKAINALSGGER
ncbi:MAG: hypothetical protein FJW88_05355 [Actinobacteria bacterium]|nr:hypothetical protein [Actinomycetota bacterium]